MKIRAVIDSIEVGKALLLIFPDQKYSVLWPQNLLPEGAKEGDILSIDLNIDHETTEEKKAAARERIERLVKRNQMMDKKDDK